MIVAMQGIEQPEIIRINDTLQLRKYGGEHDSVLAWFRNEDTVCMVYGNRMF